MNDRSSNDEVPPRSQSVGVKACSKSLRDWVAGVRGDLRDDSWSYYRDAASRLRVGAGAKAFDAIMARMTLTVPIPDNLDKTLVDDLDHVAREAVAVKLYREGQLSHGKFAQYLGVGRGQVDEILTRHGVLDEFTAEEITEQVRVSRDLRRAEGAE